MALHIHSQGRFNNHTVCSLYRILVMETDVMGVMKMWNIVPRAGIEYTSLTFPASVLRLHHVSSIMSSLSPRLSVYAAPCHRGQCRLLYIYIYIYVYIYMCVYVCICIYICINIYICVYVFSSHKFYTLTHILQFFLPIIFKS